MATANLDLDSLANLHWLEAAILLGHSGTTLKGFRLRNFVIRNCFADSLGVLKALLVRDLLLPSLRHCDTFGLGDVVALLPLHHHRLIPLNF